MKKIWAPIWFVSYLVLSVGVSVNFHYCMNKLASASLYASSNRACDECGMHINKSHGCCRDEVKIVKIEDDQKATAALSFSLPIIEPLIGVPSTFFDLSFINAPSAPYFQDHSPPFLSTQDLYLQNGVFRI